MKLPIPKNDMKHFWVKWVNGELPDYRFNLKSEYFVAAAAILTCVMFFFGIFNLPSIYLIAAFSSVLFGLALSAVLFVFWPDGMKLGKAGNRGASNYPIWPRIVIERKQHPSVLQQEIAEWRFWSLSLFSIPYAWIAYRAKSFAELRCYIECWSRAIQLRSWIRSTGIVAEGLYNTGKLSNQVHSMYKHYKFFKKANWDAGRIASEIMKQVNRR